MFILVNIIFTFVLGLLDAMLGWQRAGGEGVLTTLYGVLIFFTVVGRAVPSSA
nr:Inner membrane protein YhaH [Salmonella sp. NCTC 7297]